MTQPIGEEFILIRPSLAGFRAQLETELKTALAGIKPQIAVQAQVAATRAAAAPQQAAARAAQAVKSTGLVATANLTEVASATDRVTAANERLAVAAAKTRAEVGGIVLPAGVRDAVSVTQAAAKAQTELAAAAQVTKKELAGIVLPPGIRSVTVATEEAAAAQTHLAASARATKAELAALSRQQRTNALAATGERQLASGLVLPPSVAPIIAPTNEASKAQEKLATTTKSSKDELAAFAKQNKATKDEVAGLTRNVAQAETALGRTSRGLVAATAASTGFFRAVSFASGAFLVGAGIGATIGAAVSEFKQMITVGAQTAAVIKATGGSANVTAKQVNDLALQQLKLTGTDDELVKSSANILLTFRAIRNEVGAGNDVFTRALVAVQDISSVFKTDLRGSAVQVGKALQDPIRGVTALRRSGITLSQAQRDLIKNLVETGRTFTAQKIILSEIEKQVGGTAAAIGKTLPGQLAILRESAKNSLGEFVKRISESQQAAEVFADTTGGIGDAFRAITPSITAAGKAIGISVAGAEQLNVLRPVVKTITLLAVAFGAVKLALGAASTASAVYVRATTVQTAASAAAGAAAEAEALALGATAAAATAAGTAAAASAARVGILAGALNLLKGPLGIAVLLTGATLGFLKLRDVLANSTGTINATKKALDGLSDSVERNRSLTGSLAGAREDVSIARFDVTAAQRGVSRAQEAVTTSPAQRGSIEQIGLANRLTDATNKLGAANRALATAEERVNRIEGQVAQNQRTRQFVITETIKGLNDQIAALGKRRIDIPFVGSITVPIKDARHEVSRFDALMADLIAKGTPLEQKVGRALETIRKTLGDIPSQKQVTLAIRLIGQGRSLDQVLSILGAGRGTEAIRARGITPPPDFKQQQEESLRAALANVAAERKRLGVLREINQTRKQELATAEDQLDAARQAVTAAQDQQRSARQALADARRAATEARQNVKDTIAAGQQAIADAVTSAKGNLDQLGQSIAEALGKAGDVVGGSLSPARFQALRDQILRGAGGPTTQQARQQLQSEIQGGTAAGARDLATQFGDLTNAFNTGKISLPQFNRQFTALLKGLDISKFRKQFGTAAADFLLDAITKARQQAGLIARGPQRPGGGRQETTIDPAKAVAQAARDTLAAGRQFRDATRGVSDAARDVQRSNKELVRAEQRLREAQTAETKANTRATRANTRAQLQLQSVLRAISKKDNVKPKTKGQGNEARNSGALTNAGANSP